MKRNYKILDTKNCGGVNFRIVRDLNGIGAWQYIIQYEINYRKKFKKIWRFQKYQFALDDFDCENMLKRVVWKENLK